MPSRSPDRHQDRRTGTGTPERPRPLPGPGLWLFAFAGLGYSLLVPWFPFLGPTWFWVPILVLAIALVGLRMRPPFDHVDVRRHLPPRPVLGRACSYSIEVHNDSKVAVRIQLREVLHESLEGESVDATRILPPGERWSLTIPFVPLERGPVELPATGVALSRPRSVLAWRVPRTSVDEMSVQPGRPAGELKALLSRFQSLIEVGDRQIPRSGSDWEFDCMREYVPGDDLRRVDWKASARRQRPMTRQFREERNSEIMLALDCGRLMGTVVDGIRKLDLAMTPLLDLAAISLRRGEKVGLLAFDDRTRVHLAPRSGMAQLGRIQKALAELPKGENPTSFLRAVNQLEARHRKRSLVLIFTDFTDEISASEIFRSLSALERRHELVFVGVSDPGLEQIYSDEQWHENDLFQRAVAGSLLHERRRTLMEITRMGIHAIDAEPSRLTAPLIATYLEIKFSGRL